METYPEKRNHVMLARAITSKRAGTHLYTDDGSAYFPIGVRCAVLGRNLTFYTVLTDASDTLVDMPRVDVAAEIAFGAQ